MCLLCTACSLHHTIPCGVVYTSALVEFLECCVTRCWRCTAHSVNIHKRLRCSNCFRSSVHSVQMKTEAFMLM